MKLTMDLGVRSYDIILKRGALQRVGQVCNLQRKVLVVSDEGVPQKYIKTLVGQCEKGHAMVLPQGEDSKSPAAWQSILSRMLALGFGRHDAVAALGGGVVGDVAGFAAAAYMRGIQYYQLPTTTLSQVDSSIGGKVAINLDGTKNIVGAFHQPALVVIDPGTLQTLPKRHYANGLAEALKAGLIGNASLFELMERGDVEENIERILHYSLLYKKQIVEQDETEQGVRMLLNFGHTIGHGIEAVCGLREGSEGLLHGECVALGMLPMIESRTLRKRTLAVMKKLGLPTRYTCKAQDILRYMGNDKKRDGDSFTVVRVKTLGEGYLETMTYDELALLVKAEVGNG